MADRADVVTKLNLTVTAVLDNPIQVIDQYNLLLNVTLVNMSFTVTFVGNKSEENPALGHNMKRSKRVVYVVK